MIELNVFDGGEIGADIRNKLSSPMNLVVMLKQYFDEDNEFYLKKSLLDLIKIEMNNTEKKC
jgi:hypothetical protein